MPLHYVGPILARGARKAITWAGKEAASQASREAVTWAGREAAKRMTAPHDSDGGDPPARGARPNPE